MEAYMQTKHLAILVITMIGFHLPKQLIYLMFVYISIVCFGYMGSFSSNV